MTHSELIAQQPVLDHFHALGWQWESREYSDYACTENGNWIPKRFWMLELTPPDSAAVPIEFEEPFAIADVWREYAEDTVYAVHSPQIEAAFLAPMAAIRAQLIALYARKLAGDESVVIPAEITVPAFTVKLAK